MTFKEGYNSRSYDGDDDDGCLRVNLIMPMMICGKQNQYGNKWVAVAVCCCHEDKCIGFTEVLFKS